MKNINIYCYWDLKFDFFHERQIDLFVDFCSFEKRNKDHISILFILEPEEIMPQFTQMAIQFQNEFDFILTHNETILNSCKNAHLFEFGTTWIKNYDFPEKKFGVSTLVGGKKMAPGHLLREKVWYKENQIKIPKKFYLSGNFPGGLNNYNNNETLGQDKSVIFDHQFHIVIENTKRKNWFTEKLIDCLQTKTIPIYYGCPNIGDYFDLNGMYIVDNIGEIIQACNSLTENTYNEKLEIVEKNFESSKFFCKIDDRLAIKIKDLIS